MTQINAKTRPRLHSCQQLGVCQSPNASCKHHCALDDCAIESYTPFAPGVVDGPYYPRPSRGERLSRAVVLVACLLTAVVVLMQIAGYL